MFKKVEYYIVVANNGFTIKNNNDILENIIPFQPYIPNVPFYYHLFDKDKSYITEITKQFKLLKMKKVTVILPDDAMNIQVDKQIIFEYLLTCGAKIIKTNYQCFLLNSIESNYISISRTIRNFVLQRISNKQSLITKYYYKEHADVGQILSDIEKIQSDYGYERIPIFINNINNDMGRFKNIGDLISINDIFTNIIKYK